MQDSKSRQATEAAQDSQSRQATEAVQDSQSWQATEAAQDSQSWQATEAAQDSQSWQGGDHGVPVAVVMVAVPLDLGDVEYLVLWGRRGRDKTDQEKRDLSMCICNKPFLH